MSPGAIGLMIFVLCVVWGGAAVALVVAWKQEKKRQKQNGQDSNQST